MADTVLPPPAEQVRPWYSAGPRAAESETWQSLAVSLPDDPSIPVDVTPLVAAHFDFQDVSYYSLKAWLQWTEEDNPIVCISSITGCIKLIMLAHPIFSGAF